MTITTATELATHGGDGVSHLRFTAVFDYASFGSMTCLEKPDLDGIWPLAFALISCLSLPLPNNSRTGLERSPNLHFLNDSSESTQAIALKPRPRLPHCNTKLDRSFKYALELCRIFSVTPNLADV